MRLTASKGSGTCAPAGEADRRAEQVSAAGGPCLARCRPRRPRGKWRSVGNLEERQFGVLGFPVEAAERLFGRHENAVD
jgi:hypothetical protein